MGRRILRIPPFFNESVEEFSVDVKTGRRERVPSSVSE
jgi:hypothetical protein